MEAFAETETDKMFVTAQDPWETYPEATVMDQSAVDPSNIDYQFDDLIDAGQFEDTDGLFGSPGEEKTEFYYGGSDLSQPTGDEQAADNAGGNQAAAMSSGVATPTGSPSDVFTNLPALAHGNGSTSIPVQANAPTLPAPVLLTFPQTNPAASEADKTGLAALGPVALPQDPEPAKEATNTIGIVTIPDAAASAQTLPQAPALPVPELSFEEGNPLLDASLFDNPLCGRAPAETDNHMPQGPDVLAVVNSVAPNSYMPQQSSNTQHQQQVMPHQPIQNPCLTGPTPLYMPQPMRPVPPRTIATLRGFTPVAGYPQTAAPHQAMQPQPYAANSYPIPPQAMTPGFTDPYAPQLKRPAPRSGEYANLNLPPPTKRIRHRRDGNRRGSNNPSLFYRPLPVPPIDWSPPSHPDSSPPLFRYNDHGELLGNLLYSRDDLAAFLTGPQGNGKAPSRSEKLTLWIQQAPAYEAHRYGPDCGVCRWDGCPVKRNTVSKGQFRVALDERGSMSGKATDPFRVAGYMHLFCFEEVFNIHCLFFDTDRIAVRPDRRQFRFEERNPMALSGELVATLERWQRAEGRRLNEERASGVRDPATPKGRKLWLALTRAVLAAPGYLESLGRRNEIHVGTYEGDLRKYQMMVDKRVAGKREAARVIEIVDDDEDEVVVVQPTPPRSDVRAGRVAASRRPSIQRYTPPGARKRSRDADEEDYISAHTSYRKRTQTDDADHTSPPPSSRPRRPSIVRYTPPAARKRGRSDDDDEESSPPAKRPARFDLRQVQEDTKAAVRETLKKSCEREERRVSRVIESCIPAVGEMPHYKRLEVQKAVLREAYRVREGFLPKWGSLPGGLDRGRV